MTRQEKMQLLKLQMLRCIELIDTTDFDNKPKYDEKNYTPCYEWYQQAKSGRAELIAKMHEIRRDTVALEKELLKLGIH